MYTQDSTITYHSQIHRENKPAIPLCKCLLPKSLDLHTNHKATLWTGYLGKVRTKIKWYRNCKRSIMYNKEV
jgi:hypothetical protein